MNRSEEGLPTGKTTGPGPVPFRVSGSGSRFVHHSIEKHEKGQGKTHPEDGHRIFPAHVRLEVFDES